MPRSLHLVVAMHMPLHSSSCVRRRARGHQGGSIDRSQSPAVLRRCGVQRTHMHACMNGSWMDRPTRSGDEAWPWPHARPCHCHGPAATVAAAACFPPPAPAINCKREVEAFVSPGTTWMTCMDPYHHPGAARDTDPRRRPRPVRPSSRPETSALARSQRDAIIAGVGPMA
jgi:hypothetical protein